MHSASVIVIGLSTLQSESMSRSGPLASQTISGSAASGTGVLGGFMVAGTGKHVLTEQQWTQGLFE